MRVRIMKIWSSAATRIHKPKILGHSTAMQLTSKISNFSNSSWYQELEFNQYFISSVYWSDYYDQETGYVESVCDICQKVCKSSQGLATHKMMMHSEKKRSGDLSIRQRFGSSLTYFVSLLRSKSASFSPTPFSESVDWLCDLCSRGYRTQLGLLQHKRKSHPEMEQQAEVQCGECDKLCKSMIGLSIHQRVHRP